MKFKSIFLVSIAVISYLFSTPLSAQFVGPGCYCMDGALYTADASVTSLPIGSVARRYSAMPCQNTFGQADGTNCVACACTDDFNDNALLMIQNKALFQETTPGEFDLVACEDVIDTNETLLFCGPCPIAQIANDCSTFVTPDTDPTVVNTVPAMGEWALICLGILLLIISICSFKTLPIKKSVI